jgi:peptide-methionine (S)-S-oxide reductase
MDDENRIENATFAAGCFWGVESAFRRIDGVLATMVGYTGGTKTEPTYRQVCSGKTGHAEAVEVAFDPARVSYEQLLDVFWRCHDPTQLNRQGPDIGTNYRSAIFYHSETQRAAAEAGKIRLAGSKEYRGREIVTQIVPSSTFWKADESHQQYFEKCGRGYCTERQIGE